MLDTVEDKGPRAGVIGRALGAFLRDASPGGTARRFAGLAYLFRVGNAGIAFLTQILLARWMGSSEFGIYVYVWTWVVLLGTLTTLGLSTVPQRLIPAFLERGEHDRLRGFLVGGRWLAFGIASLIAGLAALGLALAGERLQAWPLVPLYLGLACLPLYALTEVQDGIARSYDWAGLAMTPTYLLRPILLIAILAGLHGVGVAPDAVSAMAAAIAATWLTALWQLLVLNRRLARRVPRGPRRLEPAAWITAALPLFMVEGFYLLLTYCDVVILERFVPPSDVAIYYAATKLVSLIAFVAFSVSAAAAHKFTALHVGERADELDALMRDAIRWTFLPSLGMASLILLAGEPLLSLFGPDFPAGYALLPVLALGLLARASLGPAEKLLNMLGQHWACACVYAFAFALNIGLNLLLVPRLGLMGAAVATSLALVVESILLFVVAKRRLAIHVFYWGGRRHQAS